MKQEKHEIRCSEIEKRLEKYCFFEKSYKNTRTKKQVIPKGDDLLFDCVGRDSNNSMRQSGGLPPNAGWTAFAL